MIQDDFSSVWCFITGNYSWENIITKRITRTKRQLVGIREFPPLSRHTNILIGDSVDNYYSRPLWIKIFVVEFHLFPFTKQHSEPEKWV